MLGFRGGPWLDIDDHDRERDKALLRSVLVGGTWDGFLLERVQGSAGALSVLWEYGQ